VTWDTPWDTPWDTMWDTTWDTWDKIGSSVRKKGLIYRAVFPIMLCFSIFIILSSIIQSSNKTLSFTTKYQVKTLSNHCTANSTTISR